MNHNYIQFNTPQFRILSDSQIEKIHFASLQIMERTGISFQNEEAIKILAKAGADVSDPMRVKIPSYVVNEALRTAPKTITLYDREGEPAIILNRMTGSHFGSSPDPRMFEDPYTGEVRNCYVEDIADVSRLIDALPNMEFALSASCNLTLPAAIDNIGDRIGVLQFILNCSKPIILQNNNGDTLRETIELLSIVRGGEEQLIKKPFCISSCEPVTPLVQGKDALEKSIVCAEKGIPNIIYGMQMAGATTPATFASCLAIANAEFLSQLVVMQFKRPGTPVIFGGMPSIMDMKTMIYPYGAPEKVLMVGALTEIAHSYKLPFYGTGAATDALKVGIQAATEATHEVLVSALTGTDLVHNVGTTFHGGFRSIELIVLADEIIDMVKVLMGGIDVTDQTLQLDLIDRVGPGGNYLFEEHTQKHFRDFWMPKIFDRSFAMKEDMKSCEKLLKERTIEILETYRPKPLPENVVQELMKMEKSWLERAGLTSYPKREIAGRR